MQVEHVAVPREGILEDGPCFIMALDGYEGDRRLLALILGPDRGRAATSRRPWSQWPLHQYVGAVEE
jgi:hypothetical protein